MLPAIILLAAGAPPAVAITYFDNTSEDPALEPLRKGLADMLITDLSVVKSIRIVERERLNAILGELKLSKSPFIDPASAQRLGKGLAAEYLMTGSYLMFAEKMRIDAKVIRIASGEVVAGESVEGTREEFFALEKELVEILTRARGKRSRRRSKRTRASAPRRLRSAGCAPTSRATRRRARRRSKRSSPSSIPPTRASGAR